MTEPVRKKTTGEAGNGGEFGTHARSADDTQLTVERPYRLREDTNPHGMEAPAGTLPTDERVARDLAVMGIDENLVEEIDLGWNYTRVHLREPHPTGAYTEVKQMFGRDPEENWIQYLGEAVLPNGDRFSGSHRMDGPALYWPETGKEIVAFEGERFPDPAPEIGMHFQGVFFDADGRELRWSSGSGHYQATITADATTIHMADGDIHRSGGPAVIRADGTEDWYIRGTKIADPRPQPSTTQVLNEGTPEERTATIGAKFDPLASNEVITGRIQTDIDMARRAGLIPENAKVTLTSRKIGYDPMFDVIIGNLDRDSVAHPDRFGGDSSPWYTGSGQTLHDTVAGIVAQHNYRAEGPGTGGAVQSRFISHVSLHEKE